MSERRAKPTTVTEYIASAPKEGRTKLRQLRACLRSAAPGAVESLKWGMPALSYRRVLLSYAAFTHHIGLYPTPSAVAAFADELLTFKTAKGSIQLPLDRPLPLRLIRRIAAFRVRELQEHDAKWRTPRRRSSAK